MELSHAIPDDLATAGYILSDGDRLELDAMKPGRDPVTVLLSGYDHTSMVIKDNGRILAVGGSTGCLWFVTTTEVRMMDGRKRREFLRLLKGHLEVCRARMDPETLTNRVHAGNYDHIRLLMHLKARFDDHVTMSPGGQPFIQFWL